MKKIILMLVALILTTGAFAQPGPRERREFNPEEMATRQVDRIKSTCEINEEQSKKLNELFLKQAKAQKEMMDKMAQGEPPTFDHEAMRKRIDEQNAAVKEILTAEQFEKYENMQKEMRGRRGPGGPNGFGGHGPSQNQ